MGTQDDVMRRYRLRIMNNRYEGIYNGPMQGYRVGASCPVVYVKRERRFHGWYVSRILGLTHMHAPPEYMNPIVMRFGVYGSGYPAVVA